VLREVKLIAAEDTRRTRKLLDHYDIHQPLISYFEHNEISRVGVLIERLAQEDVALVSDAGMPGISDPGYDLVRAAVEAGVRVVPVPGPSAPVAALAASGLPTSRFLYLGFLPRRGAERQRLLESLRDEPATLIAFESLHRLAATLTEASEALGDRRAVVARELTKLHEELVRGRLVELARRFSATPARGEITLVIEGTTASPTATLEVSARAAALAATGGSLAEAAAQLAAETGVRRREAYRLLLALRDCANM
jgi:16S rRNA (cytidine1402-2'-O)-methyltransferase